LRGTLFDASALTALVLKEEGWEGLYRLLPSSTLDLAFVESYNAVWKHVRVLRDLEEGEKVLALKALEKVKNLMRVLEVVDYLGRAYEIAEGFGITVYDASYVAACEAEGLALVTLDERQRRAASELGVKVIGPRTP